MVKCLESHMIRYVMYASYCSFISWSLTLVVGLCQKLVKVLRAIGRPQCMFQGEIHFEEEMLGRPSSLHNILGLSF